MKEEEGHKKRIEVEVTGNGKEDGKKEKRKRRMVKETRKDYEGERKIKKEKE